jgi:hypothetical protein
MLKGSRDASLKRRAAALSPFPLFAVIESTNQMIYILFRRG